LAGYTQQDWKDGDPVNYPLSDTRMLHMEQGIYDAHYVAVARAHNAGSQAIPSATDTALQFDTDGFDSNGAHDATHKSRFVAPATGKYVLSAHVAFAASATGVRRVRLRRTHIADASVDVLASDAKNAVGGSLTTDFSLATAATHLNAGDYVEVVVYQDSGASLNVLGGDTGRYCSEFALSFASAFSAAEVGGGFTPVTVALPSAPGMNYTIPPGAISASDGTQLINRLASTTPADIVVEDGAILNGTTPLAPAAAHRVYARNAGMVTFKRGIQTGSLNGLAFYGITWDVSTLSKTLNGACLHVWGTAQNIVIQDCIFKGNGIATYGVLAYAPQGLVLRRCSAENMTDVGFRLSDNAATSRSAAAASTVTIDTVADVTTSGCYRRVADGGAPIARGSSNGTGEAGLLVGHKVTNGILRVQVTDTGWSGILFANGAKDTIVSGVTVDHVQGIVPPGDGAAGSDAGTAVYFERYADGMTLQSFQLGSDIVVGVASEWNHNVSGDEATVNLTVKDGTINCGRVSTPNRVGVSLDQGTDHPTVTNVKFISCDRACIVDRSNPASVDSSTWPTAVNGLSTLATSNNDYGGLTPVHYGV
jgi:hypothetical protein